MVRIRVETCGVEVTPPSYCSPPLLRRFPAITARAEPHPPGAVSYRVDMSCIRFNTPAQHEQIRKALLEGRGWEEPVAQFLSPQVTETKVARLIAMSTDTNPKIRESVALSYHAPTDVYLKLARDPDPGVRECLARNPHASCDVLRILATDSSERVRAFVAVNYAVPEDAMDTLATDDSELVRALVEWKSTLRDDEMVSA